MYPNRKGFVLDNVIENSLDNDGTKFNSSDLIENIKDYMKYEELNKGKYFNDKTYREKY